MIVLLFSDVRCGFINVIEPSWCIDNISLVSIFLISTFDG